MKCKCENTTHGHRDPCDADATRKEDQMCEDCHKKAAGESAATEPGNPSYVPR